MFFELQNGKVQVTEQALMNKHIKELYELDHSKGKERFTRMATYMFFVYDKRSIYRNLSLDDRRKIVCLDILEDRKYWVKAEENPKFQEILSKLNELQFTHKERLLEGAKDKVDQYVKYFTTMKLDEKNEKAYKSFVRGSKDLLEFYDELEQMVLKEASSKIVGGGETKMFEDG